MHTLPMHMDNPRGWAHPVFARGARFHLARSRARKYAGLPSVFRPMVKRGSWTWVRQMARPHWFEQPVINNRARIAREMQGAIDDVRRELER